MSEFLSREQFLSPSECQDRVFDSVLWGGKLKYRVAKVGDKSRARKLATHDGDLDNEEFECALVIACTIEPKLSEMDLNALKEKSATEVNRYASTIIGAAVNPPSSGKP
jgi:hypothetical protein